MRKVKIFLIFIFTLILLSPVLISVFFQKSTDNTLTISTVVQSDNIKETVISEAMRLGDEDFCDEGLKAIIAIAKNNVSIGNYSNICTEDKDNDFYNRLEKLCEDADIDLSHKNERVYVPTSSLSSGFTKVSEEYPYITSVASPWDCGAEDFVYQKDYPAGVSIYGLNYLCLEGYSAEEALRWYLPYFQIK